MIDNPPSLGGALMRIPGVLSVGIFEKPDVIYRAEKDGKFTVMRSGR